MDSRLARCLLRIVTAAIAGTIVLTGVSLAADPAPAEQAPAADETTTSPAAPADPTTDEHIAPAPEPVDPAPAPPPAAPPDGTPPASPDAEPGTPGAAPPADDPSVLPPKTLPADEAADEDAQTGLVGVPAKQLESSQQAEPKDSSRPRSRGGSAQAADQDDFQSNPCRTNRRSSECAEFLYPVTCADPDTRECEEYVATNPCARNPDSATCRDYLTSACFDRPLGPACFFIRTGIALPNPCRDNRNSQACQDFATPQQQCEPRSLEGRECDLFLELLKFSQDEATTCLGHAIFPIELGRPPRDSVCEFFVGVYRKSCEAGAIVCLVQFGGSQESIGRAEDEGGPPDGAGGGGTEEGGGGPGGGARPLSAPFAGGDGGSDLAISDPGSEGDAGSSGDSETKSDRKKKRKRENLPRSGQDLAPFVLLGLLLAGVGAAIRRRMSRPGLTEVGG